MSISPAEKQAIRLLPKNLAFGTQQGFTFINNFIKDTQNGISRNCKHFPIN